MHKDVELTSVEGERVLSDSKQGLPSARRKAVKKPKPANKNSVDFWLKKSLKVHRFVGLSLGGGKTDKTCLTILEYYPGPGKYFSKKLSKK